MADLWADFDNAHQAQRKGRDTGLWADFDEPVKPRAAIPNAPLGDITDLPAVSVRPEYEDALAGLGLGRAFKAPPALGAPTDPNYGIVEPGPSYASTVGGPTQRPDRTLGQLAGDIGTTFKGAARSGLSSTLEAPITAINAINTAVNEGAAGLAGLFGQTPSSQIPMVDTPQFLRDLRASGNEINANEYRQDASAALEYDDRNRPTTLGGTLRYVAENPGALATDASRTAGSMISTIVPGSPAGMIALQATQQAQQTAEQVEQSLLAKGVDPQTAKAEAAKAFVTAEGIGLLAPRIVPGGQSFERLIAGQVGDRAGTVAARVALPLLGETISEGGEEGAIQATQNVFSGDPLGQGVGGATALGSLLGFGMGAVPAGVEGFDALTNPAIAPARPFPNQAPRPAETGNPVTPEPAQTSAITPEVLAAGNAALGIAPSPVAPVKPVESAAVPALFGQARDASDIGEVLAASIPPNVAQQARQVAASVTPEQQQAALRALGDVLDPTPSAPSETPTPAAPSSPAADGAAATFTQQMAAAMRMRSQEQGARTTASVAQTSTGREPNGLVEAVGPRPFARAAEQPTTNLLGIGAETVGDVPRAGRDVPAAINPPVEFSESLKGGARAAVDTVASQQGEGDADRLGLRQAVEGALGEAGRRVRYVRGLDGLPEHLRADVGRSLEQRTGQGRTAAVYDRNTGEVYLLTDVAADPQQAAFHAAHEIAGHHGLRSLLGDGLDSALDTALQNPTVARLADAISRERRFTARERRMSAEEALAELAAAARTGDFQRIADRYGVAVPHAEQGRVRAAIANVVRRIKAAFAQLAGRQTFTDDQVHDLLENAWQAAKDESPDQAIDQGDRGRRPASAALESVERREPAPDDLRSADVDRGRQPGFLERQAQDVRDQLAGLRQSLSGRVENPQSVARRLDDTRMAVFSSIMSRARSLETRNPQAQSLKRLFNLVMAAPGDSRLVGETINDAIHARAATFINRVRNILSNNGLERMTDGDNAKLRAAMLGTDSDFPEAIGDAARQLRKLMDVQREDMVDAGVNVGEVEDIGYLTRIYDEAKILSDEDRFLSDARKLFVEHEFPREVGATASDTFYGDGTLARFIGYARHAALTDETVADGLEALQAVVRRYRVTSNTNSESTEAVRIIQGIRKRVAESYGDMRASAWLHGIKTPDVSHFANGMSPSGAPITKGRELSGAADVVMARFMKTNMLDILDTYARTAAKKVEHAERFGADGSKIQALIDAASREGVPKADLEQAVTLVDSVLGLNRRLPESHLKNFADFIHAWSYLALLGRVTFSSLAESVTFALRTGNLVHTVAPLIQMQRALTRSRKGKALNEMAQVIAVNGHKAVEDVLMNRLGGDYSMSPRWSALLHRFFYATLLTPLTRAQRAYGVGAATGFLRHLSKQLQAGKDLVETRALLNEVGIPDHAAFADWLLAQGNLPDPRSLFDDNGRPTPRGQDYMVAVRRIVDQSIQNPGAEHRPAWTNSPGGRLVTGIMSFSYASYENIIKREAAVMARQLRDEGRGRALKRNANALVSASALVLAQTLTSILREMLFNWDRFKDKDDDEIAEEMVALGLSRTFGLGSADPIIQAITGLKYQRTLAETAVGAGPGLALKTLDSLLALGTDRNSDSDTAENKAYRSVYTAAIAPALNVILSRVPLIGGPAIMALSGANARNWFAEQFTRKPDARTKLDDKYQEASKELDDVLGTVNDRIAALPQDQWADELEALKAEYPSILAGVTLDVYADNASNQRKGRAGQPKTAGRDGKPGLKLQGPEQAGEGSVLGELEGYEHYDRYKKRFVSDDGIRDRISGLNKAIKNLQTDDNLTIGDLMAFARQAPSVQKVMDEYWTADEQAQARPAGARLTNKVLEELMELRRAEKRKALEVIEKGQQGEPIARSQN